jgi:UDPglucose 6-dehydrogenase
MKKVAIIGYGFVGKGMQKIFPDALIYDPYLINKEVPSATQEQVNQCDLAIVCVPTAPKGMGEQKVNADETEYLEADLSIVEETLEWLDTKHILIKSTVPPNTTEKLSNKNQREICFSPEYMGEGNYYVPPKYPDPLDPRKHDFMIIGGDKNECQNILAFFLTALGPAKKYMIMSSIEAELVKYMENTWGAMKVSFCNQWFDICETFGGSYEVVREGFLLDPRTEEMHTVVFRDKRGFGGKCYPKDLLAIVGACKKAGFTPDLLAEVWETNKKHLKKNV